MRMCFITLLDRGASWNRLRMNLSRFDFFLLRPWFYLHVIDVVSLSGNQTCLSAVQVQKKLKEMVPKQGKTSERASERLFLSVSFSLANHLIYWQNPVQSGIVFSVLLSIIITFMFLSSLAAISFWLLASLVVVGLYKLYNYVMATFLGRVQDDVFEWDRSSRWRKSRRVRSSSVFSSDVNITERQAQALANYIRSNGTSVLRQARSLFLWNNLTNSILVSPRLLLEKRNDRDVSPSSVWFCSFHSTLACRWTHWPSRWLVWSSYSLSRRSTKSTKFPSIVPRSKSSIKSINYWRSRWSVVEDERMNERRSSFRLTSKGSVKPKKA